MLGRLFKARKPSAREGDSAGSGSSAKEHVLYIDQLQQRAAGFRERKLAILKAGGAQLDHRPGYVDGWEAAIQRLLQEGELRERIAYAGFPEKRTYHYTLTPSGERAAAVLAQENALLMVTREEGEASAATL